MVGCVSSGKSMPAKFFLLNLCLPNFSCMGLADCRRPLASLQEAIAWVLVPGGIVRRAGSTPGYDLASLRDEGRAPKLR